MLVFGIALSARQLGFAIMSPLLGKIIDNYNPRIMLVAVGLISGLAVYHLGAVTQAWQLIALIAILGLVGLQGSGGDLYSSVIVAKWFNTEQNLAKRGRAMSIAFLGMPLGIFVLTPATEYLISHMGWQTTWKVYGLVGGSAFVLLALLLKSPPQTQLAIPSTTAQATTSSKTTSSKTPAPQRVPPQAPKVTPEASWTRAQAMRTPTFWKLSISFGILMFCISTVALFRVPYFIDQGVASNWVAYALSLEAVISAASALPIGWLIGRYALNHLVAIAYSIAVVMLIITINADSRSAVFVSTAIFGLGAASNVILHNAIWPNYFGAEHIGAIRGVAMPISLSFAILGAPIAGWVSDATGSFTYLWWTNVGLMFIAIGMIISAVKPQLPQDKT